MKIKEINNNNIILSMDYENFFEIRKFIDVYMQSLPPTAYATYVGFDEKQIKEFLCDLDSECKKFNLKA